MTQVKDIMQKKVITIKDDDDIPKLCRILTKRKLTGLPVVNEKGVLVGFVSERDIIAALGHHTCKELAIKKIMTKRIKTVGPDEPITNASKIFSSQQFRILPVVKNEKVVGVIARKDVIEHMLGDYH